MPEDSQSQQPATPAPETPAPAPSPVTPPAATPVPPTTPAEPEMPKPSPTVEPFQSAGGPPPQASEPKRGHKGLIIGLGIVVVLILAAVAYYAVSSGVLKLGSTTKPSPTPSSTPAAADNLDSDYQQLDSSVGQLTNDLNDADTALGDKQGDLSE